MGAAAPQPAKGRECLGGPLESALAGAGPTPHSLLGPFQFLPFGSHASGSLIQGPLPQTDSGCYGYSLVGLRIRFPARCLEQLICISGDPRL